MGSADRQRGSNRRQFPNGALGAGHELADLVVSADATLVEALQAMHRSGCEIVFIADGRHRIVGTLTDGDVRGALLAGATLESRCLRRAMQRHFAAVTTRSGRAEVLDLMRARGISQVPVLSAQGRLVGLHLLREFLGQVTRPNWAVLMAGGRGQRLRPLTERLPKPMISVAGRPILERLVLHLVGAGIRRIFISVNYLGHIIEEHFGDGSAFGCQISYLREREPLGTGGALRLLPARPRDPLIVMNGDLVTQVAIDQLLAFHAAGRYTATIGVREYRFEIPFGVVQTRRSRVVQLEEKPSEARQVSAGIYVLSPPALRLIARGREFPITDLFDACLRRDLPVGAYPIEDEWLDVGRHDDLRRARGDA